jgi:flagellar basal-body rod protein FlgF
MDRLAFNAVVAINEQQVARQMTTNELANVSTVGFKRSFEAAMRAVAIDGPGLPTRSQPQAFTIDLINLSPGSQMSTGRDLDISMDEKSVLGVSAPDGKLAFTRRGDLRINSSGVLENGGGHLVQSQNGGAITIPPGLLVTINKSGAVYGVDPALAGTVAPVLVGNLMLRDASQTALERTENGLFKVSGKPAGTDITAGAVLPSLTSRALEGSNVNAMEVMVKMMSQSRSFEQQVNLIKESKQCDESGASMMKSS